MCILRDDQNDLQPRSCRGIRVIHSGTDALSLSRFRAIASQSKKSFIQEAPIVLKRSALKEGAVVA